MRNTARNTGTGSYILESRRHLIRRTLPNIDDTVLRLEAEAVSRSYTIGRIPVDGLYAHHEDLCCGALCVCVVMWLTITSEGRGVTRDECSTALLPSIIHAHCM
jgi:hypothetical protein